MRVSPWRIRRPIPPGPAPWRNLEQAWGLTPQAARLAWLRGVDRPEELESRLDPAWERTHDPCLLTDMGCAVDRIRCAIGRAEPICVYGDYDGDGVTATALLVRVLGKLGADVSFFIPNRFDDGYGLHLDCIRELAAKRKAGLFISVDCGVRAHQEVAASRELGWEWVITDHHSLGETLPEACAVLHPERGEHPNRHLAGVGVAFKLAQALLDAIPVPRQGETAFLDGLLKLVAIGTIADMVPLTGENAVLVKRGLRALGGANSPGIAALLRAAKVEGNLDARQIAFGVAPRLNAIGRMGGAEDAVKLLLARDESEARTLAEQAERLNGERKAVQDQLLRILPSYRGESFELLVEPDAHKGVLGIVAGQRMRETGIPTAICTVLDGVAHCSLRAPEGCDLTALLDMAQPFLLSGGGHRTAAGMTFEMARLSFVREAFRRGAGIQTLRHPLALDGQGMEALPEACELAKLEPFGQGFPEPTVRVAGGLQATPRLFGKGHLKLRLETVPGELTWFSAQEILPDLAVGAPLSLALACQDHPRWGRSWQVKALLEQEEA